MKFILAICFSSFSMALGDFASFKLVKCDCNEFFIYPNASCYAKSYSRNMSTMNVEVYLKQPIYEVFVSSFNCVKFLDFDDDYFYR